MPIDLGQVLTRGPVNLLLAYALLTMKSDCACRISAVVVIPFAKRSITSVTKKNCPIITIVPIVIIIFVVRGRHKAIIQSSSFGSNKRTCNITSDVLVGVIHHGRAHFILKILKTQSG